MATPKVETSPDKASLAEHFAGWLVTRFADTSGPFALNLSGGSTPKSIYELLATDAYSGRFDWGRVHVFFGDERFVPPDHPDSNYRMAREALLSKVPIPTANVHPVPTTGVDPEQAAAQYAATLKRFHGGDALDPTQLLFAVTLLGLGEDGHTASLFPGTAALDERETWVTAVVGAKPEPRITMTYPVLAASRDVVFLVAGAGKRAMLARLLAGDTSIPAARVATAGDLTVFCDESALGEAR